MKRDRQQGTDANAQACDRWPRKRDQGGDGPSDLVMCSRSILRAPALVATASRICSAVVGIDAAAHRAASRRPSAPPRLRLLGALLPRSHVPAPAAPLEEQLSCPPQRRGAPFRRRLYYGEGILYPFGTV